MLKFFFACVAVVFCLSICLYCGSDIDWPDDDGTAGVNQDSIYRDSVFRDSVFRDSVHRDSVYRDSVYRDSLHRDSLHRDSLHRDSLHRDSLHRDSLHRIRTAHVPFSVSPTRLDIFFPVTVSAAPREENRDLIDSIIVYSSYDDLHAPIYKLTKENNYTVTFDYKDTGSHIIRMFVYGEHLGNDVLYRDTSVTVRVGANFYAEEMSFLMEVPSAMVTLTAVGNRRDGILWEWDLMSLGTTNRRTSEDTIMIVIREDFDGTVRLRQVDTSGGADRWSVWKTYPIKSQRKQYTITVNVFGDGHYRATNSALKVFSGRDTSVYLSYYGNISVGGLDSYVDSVFVNGVFFQRGTSGVWLSNIREDMVIDFYVYRRFQRAPISWPRRGEDSVENGYFEHWLDSAGIQMGSILNYHIYNCDRNHGAVVFSIVGKPINVNISYIYRAGNICGKRAEYDVAQKTFRLEAGTYYVRASRDMNTTCLITDVAGYQFIYTDDDGNVINRERIHFHGKTLNVASECPAISSAYDEIFSTIEPDAILYIDD